MKKVPNAARDLNAARLYVKRLWGDSYFNSKTFEGVEYFTLTVIGVRMMPKVTIVFYTQPTLHQYLQIAHDESKFNSRHVQISNIAQLSCWRN